MIPVAEIRAYVKATNADDAILVKMELAAVAFLERETGHYFGEPDQAVEILSGPSTGPLYLTDAPGDSLTLEHFSADSWNVVSSSSYEVDGNAVWAAPSLWVRGSRNYRATYTRGYDAGSEPADIRQLVMDMVAAKWKTRGTEGMKSESISGYAYTRADITDIPMYDETLRNWIGEVLA